MVNVSFKRPKLEQCLVSLTFTFSPLSLAGFTKCCTQWETALLLLALRIGGGVGRRGGEYKAIMNGTRTANMSTGKKLGRAYRTGQGLTEPYATAVPCTVETGH